MRSRRHPLIEAEEITHHCLLPTVSQANGRKSRAQEVPPTLCLKAGQALWDSSRSGTPCGIGLKPAFSWDHRLLPLLPLLIVSQGSHSISHMPNNPRLRQGLQGTSPRTGLSAEWPPSRLCPAVHVLF